MMRRVEFMFDFGSPNAYLAETFIPEVERRTERRCARHTPNAHIQITLSAREGSRRQTVNMLSSEERHECDAH
jgi:hypothetical protein